MRRALIAVACLALISTGCGGKKEPGAAPAPTCTDPATTSGEAGKKPSIKIPNCTPPTTLQKVDLITGTGAEAKLGATLTFHYVGVSWTYKQEFDSSWDKNAPLTYALDKLIEGWKQGIPGMKVGGRRMLTIPPELGYGSAPGSPKIATNDTLVFVIDLLKA
jgi:peptidylprolyl isomerase